MSFHTVIKCITSLSLHCTVTTTECDCNGYDAECNSKTGVCQCYDVGVTGQHCTVCDTNNSYVGDADNICYCKCNSACSDIFVSKIMLLLTSSSDKMSVGFIYTFGVTETRERESFYLAVPKDDKKLTFEFNINSNPRNQDVMVQLFLGKGELSSFLLCLSDSPSFPLSLPHLLLPVSLSLSLSYPPNICLTVPILLSLPSLPPLPHSL